MYICIHTCIYVYTHCFIYNIEKFIFLFYTKRESICVFIHICMYRYRKVATLSLLRRICGQQERRQYLHQTGEITIRRRKEKKRKEGHGGRCGQSTSWKQGRTSAWRSDVTWCAFIDFCWDRPDPETLTRSIKLWLNIIKILIFNGDFYWKHLVCNNGFSVGNTWCEHCKISKNIQFLAV